MGRFICLVAAALNFGLVQAQTTQPSPVPVSPTVQENPALSTDFLAACWKGDLAKATELLNQGAPLEGRDSLGRTGLFMACHGDPDVVKMLIARGAKIDAGENDGDFPIAHACDYGDLASAQMLLAAGAGPELAHANMYGRTALMLAARGGHDDLISLLISQHVDVNFSDQSAPALYLAVMYDHLSTAKLLFDAGADIHVKSTGPPDPKSPRIGLLGWAALTNDLDLIDLLLDHGVDANDKAEDGATPLLTAVSAAQGHTVFHFLDKGADVNAANDAGMTPLMRCPACQDITVLLALLDHGAKVDATDKKGRTALMYACETDYQPAVDCLLAHGADINATDTDGDTALMFAANRGKAQLVQYLEGKGATVQEFHIIRSDEPLEPLSLAQRRALAVSAIYVQLNGKAHFLLGGGCPYKSAQRELHDDWNVSDKATLLHEVDALLKEGHRQEILAQGAKLVAMNDADFAAFLAANPTQADLAKALRACSLKWKERSGLAWDLVCAANMINLGFAAHYLSESEAWDQLMPIATRVEGSFGSWQEMDDNFLDARNISPKERDPRFEACAKLLLNSQDPNSPWNHDTLTSGNTSPPVAN